MYDTDVVAWTREALQMLAMECIDNKITYDFSRLASRMGEAIIVKRGDKIEVLHIRLSEPLWLRATEDERRECVFHEVCHLVRFYQGDLRDNHHDEWRKMMQSCGYSGSPYHTVSTEDFDKYRVNCGCPDGVLVSRKVLLGLLSGRYYVCRKCRQYVSVRNVLAPKTEKAELAAV